MNPFSTVATLAFVLLVTSIKEGSEDLQRYRSDKEENNRLITTVSFDESGEIVETIKETYQIKAGDIVKLTGMITNKHINDMNEGNKMNKIHI